MGQVLPPVFIARPEGLAAIDVKPAVAPVHHVVDDKLIDHAFFFEQRKHFPAKGILQILCRRLRPLDEQAISVKTAVDCDNVEIGVKV